MDTYIHTYIHTYRKIDIYINIERYIKLDRYIDRNVVSLFNGISTIMGYLTPKLSL